MELTVSSDSKASATAAMMNFLKGNIGTGILSMPIAFSHAGLIVGTLGIPIVGFICTHAMFLLVNSQNRLMEKFKATELSYEEVAEKAFSIGPDSFKPYSTLVSKIVSIFLTMTQIGITVAYVLFVAESFRKVFRNYFPSAEEVDLVVYVMALYPFMVALNLIKTLKYLAIASTIANLLQGTGLLLVFANLFQDLPAIETRKFTNWEQFPLYFGTAIFAFEGISIVLPIKESMKHPKKFGGPFGILSSAMTIICTLYILMGFFGYLKFGESVHGSVTLDLPAIVIYDTDRLMFAISIFLSYPLQLYVPLHIIWPFVQAKLPLDWQKSYLVNGIYRALLVLVTFILAAFLPHLDLVISLVGAFSSSFICLIFPPIIHWAAFWDERRKYGAFKWNWILFKGTVIVLIGFIGFFLGTYTSVLAIWNAQPE